MNSGSFLARDLRLVRSAPLVQEPLSIGDVVRLNSGGPKGLIVDFLIENLLAVAWENGTESALPRACLTKSWGALSCASAGSAAP
jgi:hypothetical protein